MMVPTFPTDGTNEMLLHVMGHYKKAAASFSWQDNKLFNDFGAQLEDKVMWNACASQVTANNLGFAVAVKTLLASRLPSDAWEKHVHMLRNISKLFKMSPQEFKTNLLLHNLVLPHLPGAPDPTSPESPSSHDSELKRLFLKAQHKGHQDNFRKTSATMMRKFSPRYQKQVRLLQSPRCQVARAPLQRGQRPRLIRCQGTTTVDLTRPPGQVTVDDRIRTEAFDS